VGPNYLAVTEEIARQKEHRQDLKQKLNAQAKRLAHRASEHRQEASRSHQKRSKRKLAPKDHDAKAKINLARYSGKDGQSGRLLKQTHSRVERIREQADKIACKKDFSDRIWVESGASKRDYFLNLPAGCMKSGGFWELSHPNLLITPGSRIGIIGPNGSGKSTLLKALLPQLAVPPAGLLYLPQELDAEQEAAIWQEFLAQDPESKGKILSMIGRLGSDPKGLLRSARPSPGEIRKLVLAKAFLGKTNLIVLDEPTNHLDLPSVQATEIAYQESPAALLLVSHDQAFLAALTDRIWEIKPEAGENRLVVS